MYEQSTTFVLTPSAKEKAPAIERRAHERCRCRRRPAVRILARPGLISCRGTLRDVSKEGIGLLVPRPFDVGSILAVELCGDDAGFTGVLTARVRHATPQKDGSWIIGCSLAKALSHFELFSLL